MSQILKHAMAAQAQPQLAVATPINDTQLVALIAAQLPSGTAPERISLAMDLVAEACVQMRGGRGLQQRVEQIANRNGDR